MLWSLPLCPDLALGRVVKDGCEMGSLLGTGWARRCDEVIDGVSRLVVCDIVGIAWRSGNGGRMRTCKILRVQMQIDWAGA